MQYSLDELRQKIFGKVYDVYDVFKNYFGEEFTDLQELPNDSRLTDAVYACTDIGDIDPDSPIELSDEDFITIRSRFNNTKGLVMVWWPNVIVTNENNRSVKIKDLFAKIEVTLDGTIPMENHGFQLTRSTFSRVQASSGYVHSHVPSHYDWNHVPEFSNPCLGTGPIKRTIVSLKTDNSTEMWMLFCNELALYVTVESLTGGPYKKLEQIGYYKTSIGYTTYTKEKTISRSFGLSPSDKDRLQEFAYYYITHGHLAINYCEGEFCAGMPYFDFMIDISNNFIEWFNANGTIETKNRLLDKHIIEETTVKEGQFYVIQKASTRDIENCNGCYMFVFKGKRITLHIEDDEEQEEHRTTLILNHKLAMFILCNILRIINYHYTNGNTNNTEAGQSAPVSQTVYYV
jgi:hypothetical protein